MLRNFTSGQITAAVFVLSVIAIMAIIAYRRFFGAGSKTSAKQQREPLPKPQSTVSNPGDPLYVAEPAGDGIQIIMHRSAYVGFPHVLGTGNDAYVADVLKLFTEFFGTSEEQFGQQDKVWANWLTLKDRRSGREPRDLIDLLEQDVSDEFKARALTILFLPGLRFSPFEWNDDTSLENYLFMDGIILEQMSEKMQRFAMELIKLNVRYVKATPYNEKLYEVLDKYNRYILQALALLPPNDALAAELYECYEMNDSVPYFNMDFASGYEPFQVLMRAKIPTVWKDRADQWMRDVITAEQNGERQPREEWEDALRCYASFTTLELYGDKPPAAKRLASRLEFIIGFPKAAEREMIESYLLSRIFAVLAGSKYKNLRYKLARYAVIDCAKREHGGLRVYGAEEKPFATSLLLEFGEQDTELADRIRELLEEADERIERDKGIAEEKQNRTEEVMGSMRATG